MILSFILIAEREAAEEPLTTPTGVGHLDIACDANAKSNAIPFEEFDPVRPNKCSIRSQTLDAVMSKFEEKMLENPDAFEGIRIAACVQKDPQEWNRHTFME